MTGGDNSNETSDRGSQNKHLFILVHVFSAMQMDWVRTD